MFSGVAYVVMYPGNIYSVMEPANPWLFLFSSVANFPMRVGFQYNVEVSLGR